MYDVTELLTEGRRDFRVGRNPLIGRICAICFDVDDAIHVVSKKSGQRRKLCRIE